MSRRIDTWTCAGIAVTATAAATASAGTQHQLAVAAGWGSVSAWMLPVCVDALAAVAARVWLDSTAGDTERRYARTVALSAVVVSLSLNSVGHAVAAGCLGATTGGGRGDTRRQPRRHHAPHRDAHHAASQTPPTPL